MNNGNYIKPGDIIISGSNITNKSIFYRSVILIIASDYNILTGIIVNKLMSNIDVDMMLRSLSINLNLHQAQNYNLADTIPVYYGGPIEPEKGIIMYYGGYQNNSTFINISPNIKISFDSKVVFDIASGAGPSRKMMLLGYVVWASTQLVQEIKQNNWLVISKDNENQFLLENLIFQESNLTKWQKALSMVGINNHNLSSFLGNA